MTRDELAEWAVEGSSYVLGRKGEFLAGINPKLKGLINIQGRGRIPDFLNFESLMEVKNVKNLSNTLQLQDYATYAKNNQLPMKLFVRPNTKGSEKLLSEGWEIIYLW